MRYMSRKCNLLCYSVLHCQYIVRLHRRFGCGQDSELSMSIVSGDGQNAVHEQKA
jgi:hypothetical protein